MSDDLNTEIKIGADASGVEAGVGKAKRSLKSLGDAAQQAGKDAGAGMGAIGAGGDKSAKDVERATRTMQNSIQRLIAEQKAGAKGSREYWEALANTRGVNTAALRPLLDQLDAAKSATNAAKGAAESWRESLGKIGPMVAAAFSGAALAGFIGKVVSVQREFDVLNSSLKTVTGSSAAAEREMAWLKDFAKETPFGLAQATQGFVKMKALGLDPTRAALTSFGNTASAMGKDLNQMIEAVADASTGEFERLKEFGIKAKKEGDQVSLTFQGVTTTIQNSAADITKYLEDIGNTSFGGAMEERAKTLDGTIAALGDTWDELFRTVSTNNAGSLIFDSVTLANGALEDATNILKAMGGAAQDASRDTGALSTIQNGIATVFETVAVLGVNLKYVLVQIGNEIGGLAAQVAQAAQFNFSGVAAIRRQMVADAEAARKEIDATTERILNARKAQEEYARYATRNASAAQATLLAKQPAIKAPSARGKSESDSGLATLIRQAHDYAAALDYAAANGGQKMSQAEKQLAEALEKTGGKLSAANRALLEGNVAREKAAAVTRGATEAEAAWQKAQDESRAASEKQRDALQEQVARQRAANAEIGLTADGLAALEESRLRDAIATTRQEFALRQKDGADLNELKAIDDQIGAYEQLIALKRDGAARQSVADEARLASEEWKRFSDDIERSLTDSLMRSFESGENFGKTFVKSLQNTLKTTVLKVAVQAVVGDVMGAVGLGSGGSGSGSSIGSALSMGSNLSSLAGGGSILSGFGAGFSSMAGEMAMGANFVGPSAALASGSVGAGAATASAMGSTAAGMMSSVAAAAPYALAALAVADAVGLFGKGGGPQQGQYSQTTRDSFNVSHTSSGGAPLDSKALASAVLGQVDMLYSMAGRQKANVMIDQGYGFDPQGTSQDMKYRKINIDGRQLTSFDDRSVRGDSAGAAARLSHLTSKEIEAIAAAINDSKLNGIIETLKANFGDLAAAMEKYAVGQAKQQALLSLLQSDEEKQRDTTNSLFAAVGGVFNSLNVAMPDSVAGLHAFVAGLDLTTKSGADTLATLDALGPSLVSYIEAAKKVEADRRAWQEKLDVLNGTTTEKELERNRTLASTSDTATQALMRQVWAMEDQQAAATAAADAAKLAADALAELSARAASVKSSAYGAYSGLLSATGNEKGALEFNVSAAQEAYQQALAAVAGNAGISSAAAQGYIDANGGIASAAAKYWGELGSGMDEATIRSKELLTELVNAASGVAQAQTALKSFAEQPVVVADTVRQVVDDTVRQVVDDTARAQQQIRDEWQRTADSIFDTIRKLRGEVASPAQSYAAAQAQFSIATAAARAGDQGAAGQLPQLAQSVVDLGKAIAVTRVDQQLLTARTIASLSATMEGMRQFGIEIPAFAAGGYHAGGLRLVGENGPELEATGSARIYNFDQTRDMLTGGGDMRGMRQELIALRRELAALRADNSAENRAIASATAKTAKTMERFDDGDALTVRVSA